MNNTTDTFITLLRCAVTGTHEDLDLSEVNFEALYTLSRFHDLAHIVFFELRNRIDQWQGEIFRKFEQQYNMALYRAVKRDLAINQIQMVLENAGIPFILLKGAYLMKLYPETWMRTSSDIDVLVEPSKHQKAVEVLEESGFLFLKETPHDVSFQTQEKYHVELHHSLVEEGRLPKTAEILERVWQYTTLIDNCYERTINDEMQYFYHLAHMAKHLKNGGCGVRFFLDLWLLNHNTQFDANKRDELISKSGLFIFAKQSLQLSEKWFTPVNDEDDLSEFEEYVVRGGIYGSLESSVTIRKNRAKSRFLYYINRIFLPYKKIMYLYPVLKKYPILLPPCWVLRWFKLLNPKTRQHAIEEAKAESRIDSESVVRVERLMEQLKI